MSSRKCFSSSLILKIIKVNQMIAEIKENMINKNGAIKRAEAISVIIKTKAGKKLIDAAKIKLFNFVI